MKQRLLVMNGQRLVQSEQGERWKTDKVDKAGMLKPGIYNIHLASQVDKGKTHDGVVVYADRDHVYQQVGKGFFKHERGDFEKVPEIGSSCTVKYEGGKALVSASASKLGRGIS